MKLSQVAVQLYTLRDFLKTPADIAETLRKVAAIGYQAVQVSGMGPIAEEELNALLEKNGLVCCATHENGDLIRAEPAKIVDRLRKLNCKYTAYPFPAGVDWTQPDHLDRLAADLDRAGAALRAAGQVLTYHNHAIELIPFAGKTALDYLYAQTDPQNLLAEIDTYWIQYGGGNPAAWCRKLKGRLPLLHMKDYAFTTADKPVFAEIGKGNLNWPEIVAAAEASGCEWFIVEQDSCAGDPFDSIRLSFQYIKANLVG
ncbi:Sugar phosphate isomerase/epimerase [Verrucomicrobium sp. GAS474]|uniref:sugar phosphate isomerase/epimerase family protein n=1 Tax=Verrucomicrobium sp. GAS474 TaxID=1882831 RepID=UPI0008797F26|nr:sugar phosphate isomerase/epimerase [Verrucomicrobium sp. GAS474]SDU06053.1 Sugar phosphate isomerase/epimerase [Verrucomicrobium sp. GAS474]